MQQFVRVRLVQCWGLDLSLFQFDGELTWAVFFLNADRTIYGRYGSRASRQADLDVSIPGFRKALERALDVHRRHGELKGALAANHGPKPRWATPEKIPQLPGKVVPADGTRANCIHCHALPAGEVLSLRQAREKIPDQLIWAYPMPDVVGLHLDVQEAATVKNVRKDSPADRAGFRAGDRIESADGRPILSIADVQWLLHQAGESAKLKLQVQRQGKQMPLELVLDPGWRRQTDYTWRTIAWPLRFKLAGFKSSPAPPDVRQRLGLEPGKLALRIDQLAPGFVKDRNPAPQQLGLQAGDVIVAVDGKAETMSEGDFLAYLVQQKQPGDRVQLTVRRGEKLRQVEMTVP